MKRLFIPPVFLLLSFILIVIFYFFVPQLNVIPFPFNLGGILFTFIGFGCMGKTRQLFQKHKTTLFIEESSCMVTEGLFGKSRNPMYIGMFMSLFGLSICYRNLLSMAMPFVFLLTIRVVFIRVEEKLMLDTFGQEYINYKNRVRRWI